MDSSTRIYKHYKRYGTVRMTADALNLTPTHVRKKLKEKYEAMGYDGLQFHTPTQAEVIDQYMPQTFTVCRKMLTKLGDAGLAICEIDGVIKGMTVSKIRGNLIGVYTVKEPAEYMRDDIYWYITNVMETYNAQTTG